jgi:hypothetical protein
MELRCDHTMHGIVDEGVVEVKCKNNLCGARSGVVVLHRFDIVTGKLLSTNKYQDPMKKEVKASGSRNQRTTLRTA